MTVEIRILTGQDYELLASVDDDVFDNPIQPDAAAGFLDDPHHHIVVAIDDARVVGFASAVDYLHPDKAYRELWINEVGVAESHRRRGIGKSLLRSLLQHASEVGCSEAWVHTERDNDAAMALYTSLELTSPPEDAVMFSFPLQK